jgi:predicted adenine nucleotide alpha hydrolase (AANH) superfamily ATPase
MTRTLLHACCGPCSTVLSSLKADELKAFSIFFYNPNIQPVEEFKQRARTMDEFASSLGIEIIHGAYDSAIWTKALGETVGVYPLVQNSTDYPFNLEKRRSRCRACYNQRFDRLASVAKELGYDSVSTTLSVSPYQFADIMKIELQRAAGLHSVEALFHDFSPLYPQTVRISREMGMYRQNYCGCLYSKQEAEIERNARKAARKSARLSKAKEEDVT